MVTKKVPTPEKIIRYKTNIISYLSQVISYFIYPHIALWSAHYIAPGVFTKKVVRTTVVTFKDLIPIHYKNAIFRLGFLRPLRRHGVALPNTGAQLCPVDKAMSVHVYNRI